MSNVFQKAKNQDQLENHKDLLQDICSSPSALATSQELVNRYTHCSFCNSYLHFTHSTDFGANLTQEMAKCLECGLKSHKRTHRLQ